MNCACGWTAGPFARRAEAEKAYSNHVLSALPICSGCNEPKALRLMSKHSTHLCKPCSTAKTKAWALANPRAWDRSRWKSHLKKQYGITPEYYNELLDRQAGLCAICLLLPTDSRGFKAHLDHCHKTGKVRGILCGKCNKGIGMLNDDILTVERALDYLKKHHEEGINEGAIDKTAVCLADN